MIPRPVVVLVVLVLLGVLVADVTAQYVVPGHTANPVIDGAIIALIGAVITGTKGPRPETPPAPPVRTPPATEERPPGRHHYKDWP